MALTENKNYLQPTGFRLIIAGEEYKNLEYFIQSVIHPGSSVTPLEMPVARITSVPLAGDKIQYGELQVEVICDEDMTAYKEMQGWLERIVTDGQVDGNEGGKVNTYSDITLVILTSHNNKNVTFKYNDCLPTNVGQISMNSNVADVVYPTFNVSFRFSSFELK
jgi:hypothetical protein